jgi:hypothetical protein
MGTITSEYPIGDFLLHRENDGLRGFIYIIEKMLEYG